jgi:hypothetical protein
MKAFLYFVIGAILIGCSPYKRTESQNDSIPAKDSAQNSTESQNSIPDKTEFKTYTDKSFKIEESVLWTMKGQDAFYKIFSTMRAFDASNQDKLLWDSTFTYEVGSSLHFPFLYTYSQSCCASEDGFTIRDARTGKAIVRYTGLISLRDEFDFELGYNAARAMNFKLRAWHPTMGEVFTFNNKVISSFEIRHLSDSVDYSSTPQFTVVNRESAVNEIGGNIYVDQTKVELFPESEYFICLGYNYFKPVTVFIPVDHAGNINPVCITASDSSHYRFRLK